MSNRPTRLPVPQAVALEERSGVARRKWTERRLNYIGRDLGISYLDQVEDAVLAVATTPDYGTLGDVYRGYKYQLTQGSDERTYEPVFGDYDFIQAVAADPSLRGVLDRFYGNVSTDEATRGAENDIASVLGSNQVVLNRPSLRAQRNAIVNAQDGRNLVDDNVTENVRGVNDIDADIEPFA